MRKKFLNLAAALGLTTGLFVGALGGASAATGNVDDANLYFPHVANGETVAGLGPFTSQVTIQNPEDEAVDVDLMTADGTIVQEFTLQAGASQTFDAASLGITASSGAALIADAEFAAGGTEVETFNTVEETVTRQAAGGVELNVTRSGSPLTETVTREATVFDKDVVRDAPEVRTENRTAGDANGEDIIENVPKIPATVEVYDDTMTYVGHIDGACVATDDYCAYHILATDELVIDWLPGGDEPAGGTDYTVELTYGMDGVDTITGITETIDVAPELSWDDDADPTTADYTAVEGTDFTISQTGETVTINWDADPAGVEPAPGESYNAVLTAEANTADVISLPADSGPVTAVTIDGYTEFDGTTGDYTWSEDDAADTVTIDWEPAGAEPTVGDPYDVTLEGGPFPNTADVITGVADAPASVTIAGYSEFDGATGDYIVTHDDAADTLTIDWSTPAPAEEPAAGTDYTVQIGETAAAEDTISGVFFTIDTVEITYDDDGDASTDPITFEQGVDFDVTQDLAAGTVTIEWLAGGAAPAGGDDYMVTLSGPFGEKLTKGAANTVDALSETPVFDIKSVTWTDDNGTTDPADDVTTTYVEDRDYLVADDGIDWSPSGATSQEVPEGEDYVVEYTTSTSDAGEPSITGVAKMTAGSAVDGYTAVNPDEVAEANGNWVVPIFQNRTGWDSVLRITNVSTDSATVTAKYYDDNNPGGLSVFSGTIAAGATETFQASGVIPAESVGSVQIEATGGDVVAAVNRIKGTPTMALTNVAQPKTTDQNVSVPLVFKNYNNWNTGINIADTSGANNEVTVTFYDYDGNFLGRETASVPANGMRFVYLYQTAADGQVASATISGTGSLVAAIDEVKYVGETQDVGHAMSYMSSADHNELTAAGDTAVFPLIQRGDIVDGNSTGATSGINLYNSGSSTTVSLQFRDAAGNAAAPTRDASGNEAPVSLSLGNLQGVTIYTLTAPYDQLPVGFKGSATVTNNTDGAKVSGMSNNVDYDVAGDGSAVFNAAQ